MMTKKQMHIAITKLKENDVELDKRVKIQGTPYDRKRKLTPAQLSKIEKMYKKGLSLSRIAREFGVTIPTIKYNVNAEWRAFYNAKRDGKHTGKDTITFNNRVKYKRDLIAEGKI